MGRLRGRANLLKSRESSRIYNLQRETGNQPRELVYKRIFSNKGVCLVSVLKSLFSC